MTILAKLLIYLKEDLVLVDNLLYFGIGKATTGSCWGSKAGKQGVRLEAETYVTLSKGKTIHWKSYGAGVCMWFNV